MNNERIEKLKAELERVNATLKKLIRRRSLLHRALVVERTKLRRLRVSE